MLAIYRTYPLDTNKVRPFKGNKIELIKVCFDSFLQAFDGVKLDLIVLMDKPNAALREIFDGYNTEESFYVGTIPSTVNSLFRAIDIVLDKKDKFILAEDDHYFLPGSGKIIEDALDTLEFLTA